MNGRDTMAEAEPGRRQPWRGANPVQSSPACGANDDTQRCSRLELCGTTLGQAGGVGSPGWSHRSQHCLPDRTRLLGGGGQGTGPQLL